MKTKNMNKKLIYITKIVSMVICLILNFSDSMSFAYYKAEYYFDESICRGSFYDWGVLFLAIFIVMIAYAVYKDKEDKLKKENKNLQYKLKQEECPYTLQDIPKEVDNYTDIKDEYNENFRIDESFEVHKEDDNIQTEDRKQDKDLWVGKFDNGEVIVFDPSLQEEMHPQYVLLWKYKTKKLGKYSKNMARPRLKRLPNDQQREKILDEYKKYMLQKRNDLNGQ